jgi:arylsulfatase A-like enzyme
MSKWRAPGTRRGRGAFGIVVVSAAGLLSGCDSRPMEVAYDLAQRVPAAQRWSSHEVLLFGTAAAEPFLAEGFYREAGTGGEPLLWSRGECEVALRFTDVGDRAAIVDIAPYRGAREQTAEARLNGTTVARFRLSDRRSRYRVPLPAAAQRAGENRLRFVFARTASPADEEPGSLDRRQLAAAFYSLTLGGGGDRDLDDLLRRDAPRPFAVTRTEGAPLLSLVGPALVRFAVRLPDDAELRFSPELPRAARAAAGAVSFRVTFESEDRPGAERELWSLVLGGNDKAPGEVTVRLPGRAGSLARIGLDVGAVDGRPFAWGEWRAPRVLGRGRADVLEGRPVAPAEDARADGLRKALLGKNVLLVILDAARAREFSAYGYGRGTTPGIDRLAAEGVRFENAFTPAVYTLGAMSSVWTSQQPDRHHGDVSFASPLPRGRLTLADVLSGQGIYTAGFVATAVAGGFNGFDRGFREFHEVWREVGSRADVFRQVLPPWLERHKDERFFAYVHLREPHFPYDPPPPFDTRFGPEGPIPKAARGDMGFFRDVNQGRRPFSAEEREHLQRLYDGSLAYADQELGALWRALQSTGLWDRTVVIVAADHGEALGEHGFIGHNVQVFEPSARVPLIVRFPAGIGPRGRRVVPLVDLLDLAPTIADMFGVRGKGGSEKEFQGRSLLPVMMGAEGKALVLSRTIWDRPRYGLRDERWTYVYETATGAERLFDRAADPGEKQDVAGRERLRADYFRETLNEWTRSMFRPTASEGDTLPSMTREQCENLKSLGYLGGDHTCPSR